MNIKRFSENTIQNDHNMNMNEQWDKLKSNKMEKSLQKRKEWLQKTNKNIVSS